MKKTIKQKQEIVSRKANECKMLQQTKKSGCCPFNASLSWSLSTCIFGIFFSSWYFHILFCWWWTTRLKANFRHTTFEQRWRIFSVTGKPANALLRGLTICQSVLPIFVAASIKHRHSPVTEWSLKILKYGLNTA